MRCSQLRTLGISRAAHLNVYDEKPLPVGHPHQSAPRAAATPHLGYVTDDGYRMFYRDAFDDIAACASGRSAHVLRRLAEDESDWLQA
jgi:phosphoglycerate dehydrogenase-like enzyme